MPLIEATKGGYSMSDLEEMPFHRVVDLFEALCYRSVCRWIDSEPARYEMRKS